MQFVMEDSFLRDRVSIGRITSHRWIIALLIMKGLMEAKLRTPSMSTLLGSGYIETFNAVPI